MIQMVYIQQMNGQVEVMLANITMVNYLLLKNI